MSLNSDFTYFSTIKVKKVTILQKPLNNKIKKGYCDFFLSILTFVLRILKYKLEIASYEVTWYKLAIVR